MFDRFRSLMILAPIKNSYIGPQTNPHDRPQTISVHGICLKMMTPFTGKQTTDKDGFIRESSDTADGKPEQQVLDYS